MRAINSQMLDRFQALTLILIGVVALGLGARWAGAHELNPTIADIDLSGDGSAQLTLSVNLEAMIAGIGPEHDTTEAAPQAAHYDSLRQLPADQLQAAFAEIDATLLQGLSLTANDAPLVLRPAGAMIPAVGDTRLARASRLTYRFQVPRDATRLGWQYPAKFGPTILRLRRAESDTPFFAELLAPGAPETITLGAAVAPVSSTQTLLRYTRLGFDHILPKGLDHVLFIIGLFLLSARMRPLLIQVTTFTLAHSVTLAMGLLGWINIPGSVVEPLIALSIVFVAVENIFTQTLHRWRTVIVFAFGLLHGLGFAGVLRELSVSSGQFAASLIGFNIGVELGQITVVLLCFALVGYWFSQRAWYHKRIVIPASLLIALIAGYWFVERIGLLA